MSPRPSGARRTTAAAVSSQVVSIPRTRIVSSASPGFTSRAEAPYSPAPAASNAVPATLLINSEKRSPLDP
jgi:hypothetical protein